MPEVDYQVGIDIGGTFTDVVLSATDGSSPFTAKTLTTALDPVEGVMNGLVSVLAQAGIRPQNVVRAVHATTLATNLILEKRGARVALVTTAGFGDIFQLGRNTRRGGEIYNVRYQRPQPLIPREMVVEVAERVAADGDVLVPLDGHGDLLARLRSLQPEAIAVSLLHSYLNPAHEQQVLALLNREMPGVYAVASAEIWPEAGEYERAVAAVVSAYVGPTFSSYARRLSSELASRGIPARLEIMASSGGVMPAEQIAQRAVYSIESGPAAGVIAARSLGQACAIGELISFDMGGTTAKASVIRQGEPAVTHEFRIGTDVNGAGMAGEIVRIPVIDLAEVGAGGGSIAWVDRGGMLQVGPRSAGASPGPACYGLGGQEPTVTDADVVLGYLSPDNPLGGHLAIDPAASRRVIEDKVARPLGLPVPDAAQAIHDLVNAKMGAAIRMVTIRRGIDPKDYTAVGFGGAGPAHIARVAQQFGIPAVIIPPSPGVRSAFGLLVSDLAFDFITTNLMDVATADPEVVELVFAKMEEQGLEALRMAGLAEAAFRLNRTVDVRILRQRHAIPVPVSAGVPGRQVIEEADARFRENYFTLFGIKPTEPCQLLNFRVRASGSPDKPAIARQAPRANAADQARKAAREAFFADAGGYVATAVYDRALLRAGDSFQGPAIVEEGDASTVCPPGYTAVVDPFLNLRIVQARLSPTGPAV
jgi:N-methylhydantoinase A